MQMLAEAIFRAKQSTVRTPSKKPESTPTKTPGGTQRMPLPALRIVDARRANNVSILCSRFRKIRPFELASAMAAGSEWVLAPEQASALAQACPTPDECTAFRALLETVQEKTLPSNASAADRAATLQLLPPEHMLCALASIRGDMRAKMQSALFLAGAAAAQEEAAVVLASFSRACTEVRTSTLLKDVLLEMLRVGNLINAGTARGNALAIDLDSLSKIRTYRADMSEASTRALGAMGLGGMRLRHLSDFIALAVVHRREWTAASRLPIPSLLAEVPNVKRAVQLSFDTATDAIRRLQSGVASTSRETRGGSAGRGANDNDEVEVEEVEGDAPYLMDCDGLRDELATRLGAIEEDVEALGASMEATQTVLADFAKYLCGGSGPVLPQDLMQACYDFATTMDDSFKHVCGSMKKSSSKLTATGVKSNAAGGGGGGGGGGGVTINSLASIGEDVAAAAKRRQNSG